MKCLVFIFRSRTLLKWHSTTAATHKIRVLAAPSSFSSPYMYRYSLKGQPRQSKVHRDDPRKGHGNVRAFKSTAGADPKSAIMRALSGGRRRPEVLQRPPNVFHCCCCPFVVVGTSNGCSSSKQRPRILEQQQQHPAREEMQQRQQSQKKAFSLARSRLLKKADANGTVGVGADGRTDGRKDTLAAANASQLREVHGLRFSGWRGRPSTVSAVSLFPLRWLKHSKNGESGGLKKVREFLKRCLFDLFEK